MKKRQISGFTLVLALTAALSLGFVTAPAAMVASAATVDFDWDNGVLDSVLGTFTFDVLVGDVGAALPLDGWNLTFDITRSTDPGTDFSFNYVDISSDPNYVFFGNNDAYIGYLTGGPDAYNLVLGDATGDGSGVATPAGKLLARLVLDNVKYDDLFTVILDEGGSLYVDTTGGIIENFGGTFVVQVVPIPGAVLLLGSGVLCLIGLRRRQAG